MVITVRTPEKQSGYRGQAVLVGAPWPMDMAFLESPLTYPSRQWPVTKSTRTGDHVSASLGYSVLGLDLPDLRLHMLQFGDGMVWLDYSAESRPGRLAVRTWQMSSSEAKAVPTRFGESWTASSSDTGEPGAVRTFFRGDRAVRVFVVDWMVAEERGMLEDVEAALMPLSKIPQALRAKPPVLVFDEPMPLPSGANFGGLLPKAYRGKSG